MTYEQTEAAKQQRNLPRLQSKAKAFNARTGPRVGDYLCLPDLHPKLGKYTRLTHDWEDHIQTGGMNGSYFLYGSGYLNYSGSLDPGVAAADILPEIVGEKPGSVWFFDEDESGAGRGVHFELPMRVFALRPGAKLDGLDELRCPFHLQQCDKDMHRRTCNYWYLITHHAMSHRAFRDAGALHTWLAEQGLELAQPLAPQGERAHQNLRYVGTRLPD